MNALDLLESPDRCSARTREGSRCSREATIGGYCLQHYKKKILG